MSSWNTNPYLKWGFTIILFLFGSIIILKTRGEAYERTIPCDLEYLFENYEFRTQYSGTPSWQILIEKNDPEKRREWKEAYDFHHMNAVRTYTDAYNRIWWLPDVSLRQLGRDAWVAACGCAGGPTLSARLVVAFSTMLSQYGLKCLDEWDYIQDKLSWSQFHFEKCEYYASLLQS